MGNTKPNNWTWARIRRSGEDAQAKYTELIIMGTDFKTEEEARAAKKMGAELGKEYIVLRYGQRSRITSK